MYIPSWLIVVLILVGIFWYNRSKRTSVGSRIDQAPSMASSQAAYSYKLDIHIEPNWFELYKKARIGGLSDDQIHEEIQKKIKDSEDPDSDLTTLAAFR